MYYMVTAAAARLAQSMGLHRRLRDVVLSDTELEQRCNAFWVIFILEKSSSINLGRPSAMHDEDIAAKLPTIRELPPLPDGSKQYDTFPDSVKLFLIRSRVYTDLYSARAQTKPKIERLRLGKLLEKEFYEWRDAIPLEIRPGQPIRCHPAMVMPVFMLHFAYYTSLLSLYQTVLRQISWTSDDEDDKPAEPEDSSVGRISSCLEVARSIIRFLQEHEDMYLSTSCVMRLVASNFLTFSSTQFQNTEMM
jgi:hypothetical protein